MSAERERIEAALQEDETRSFRSIGRELGVSDWLVRKIARELDGDPRPMRQHRSRSHDPPAEGVSPLVGWLTFGGFVAVLALAIWVGTRWQPPLDSMDSSHDFYSNPNIERQNDETQFPE